MRRFRALFATALVFGLAGCTNDKTILHGTNPIPSNFVQIAREGRSFAENLFTPWANHAQFNQTSPANDPGQWATDINTFMTGFAGRSQAIATQTKTLLTPNVLVADLSQTGNASFLGVETAGKLNKNGTVCGSSQTNASPCTGGLFGGRDLEDDVADGLLGIAFGNSIPLLFPAIADDGKEQNGANGTPQLTTDNVATPSQTQAAFPYLPSPH